jgi:hypothetical protein
MPLSRYQQQDYPSRILPIGSSGGLCAFALDHQKFWLYLYAVPTSMAASANLEDNFRKPVSSEAMHALTGASNMTKHDLHFSTRTLYSCCLGVAYQ